MPTKERYAKMSEKQKQAYRDYAHERYKKTGGADQKRYAEKHREELREIAYFEYHENPKVKNQSIKRAMKSYRKRNPVVKRLRLRRKGELFPPKTCPCCNKAFTPNHKEQIYCSSKCFAEHKGYLNLPQYKISVVNQDSKKKIQFNPTEKGKEK